MISMIGETILVDGSPVENVLVEPSTKRDSEEVRIPAGAIAEYTLRLPTDARRIESGSKVTVRGRVLDALACDDHWRPAERFGSWSGSWDMTAIVGRAFGELNAFIEVIALSTSLNALGDPVTAETAVFEGLAQARRDKNANSSTVAAGESAISDARELWWFVFPWSEGVAALRPQHTRVDCDGVRYDVLSIENVGGKSEYASVKAVRHG